MLADTCDEQALRDHAGRPKSQRAKTCVRIGMTAQVSVATISPVTIDVDDQRMPAREQPGEEPWERRGERVDAQKRDECHLDPAGCDGRGAEGAANHPPRPLCSSMCGSLSERARAQSAHPFPVVWRRLEALAGACVGEAVDDRCTRATRRQAARR